MMSNKLCVATFHFLIVTIAVAIEEFRIPLTFDGYFFHGPIKVGGKTYPMVFSFQSSSIWLFGKDVEDDIGEDDFDHIYYEKESETDLLYRVRYADGATYAGTQSFDIVEIGGIELSRVDGTRGPVPINIVDELVEDANAAWTELNGVVGLGVNKFDFGSERTDEPPPFLLMSDNPGRFPKFALHLTKDGKSGQLLISHIDRSLYHAPLTYTPILKTRTDPDKAGGWVVTLGGFLFGQELLAKNVPIEVNLASNAIWAPRAHIQTIIDSTHGAAKWDKYGHVSIDCDKRGDLPNLVFKFNQRPFEFEPEEYFPEFEIPGYTMRERKCALFMLPSEGLPNLNGGPLGDDVHPSQQWCLGVPFLKKYYTVYERTSGADDWMGERPSWQIGFALAKHDNE